MKFPMITLQELPDLPWWAEIIVGMAIVYLVFFFYQRLRCLGIGE